MIPPRAWRSLLFVPADATRFVAGAHRRGADAIILDLEDGVAPASRDAARAALPEAVASAGQAGAGVLVRINRPLEMAVADIAAAAIPGVAALVAPKLRSAEHVVLLDEVIAVREMAQRMPRGTIGLVGMVETAAALPHLFDIARAPRMIALGIGAEDLATELGAPPSADSLYTWAVHCVAAARAAGISPLGSLGALSNIRDLDVYRAALSRAKQLGFSGTSCIHPSQVPIANDVFGAALEELARARALLNAYAAALASGAGAVEFEGRMVDFPVAERARQLLEDAAHRQG